jgi:hypothetical protein
VPIDPKSLPKDPEILQQMLVDVTTQLDKTQRLLRQLLAARSGVRSEQISADQLALFAQELGIDTRKQGRRPRPRSASCEYERREEAARTASTATASQARARYS